MTERKHVTIWTDGACVGNPGPGGYAAILTHGESRREITGGYRRTTNNRMELMAVIASLRELKYPCRVTVFCDSRYVVDGVMKKGAMLRWRQQVRGVPNVDLWDQVAELCERHEVTMTWVRGHAGEEGNERCDLLALQAAREEGLPVDEGYENPRCGEVAPTLFDALP